MTKRAESVLAYVALGANLGAAALTLQQAVQALNALPTTRLERVSSFYKTAALATDSGHAVPADGPEYVNAVVALQTGLSAPALLQALQALELLAGRERSYRNAPRTLDLDLLLYGSARMESAQLTVPHPRMLLRAFVLQPLAEIAPHLVSEQQLDAVRQQTIERLND